MSIRAFSSAGPCARATSTSRAHVRASRVVVVRAAQSEDSFMDKVKMMAKKVQGSMPIVGLVSRLTSPEGGFDELAYPEFARMSFEKSSEPFRFAMDGMEKAHGKMATSRWVLLMLWMCKQGVGLVAPRDIINAARRMRVTQDMEIELDRFEGAKQVALKKYEMMAKPEGKLQDQVTLAVDALCVLCIGLKDTENVPESDVPLLVGLVQETFPAADVDLIKSIIADRESRATAYLNPR